MRHEPLKSRRIDMPLLSTIVAGFPEALTTVNAIIATQQETGVYDQPPKAELSPRTTYTWSEIYLELIAQGYEETLLAGPEGPVPGYRKVT